MLVAGAEGSGRTAVGFDWVHHRADAGEVSVCVTDVAARRWLAQAEAFALDLAPQLRDGRLVLLEWEADLAPQLRTPLGVSLAERLREAAPEATGWWIDAPSAWQLGGDEPGDWAEPLLEQVETAGGRLVLTVDAIPGARLSAAAEAARSRCGAWIELERGRDGEHRARRLDAKGAATGPPLRFSLGPGGPTPLGDPLEPEAGAGVGRVSRRPSLVIADDDAVARDLMQAALESRYEVRTAADGVEAVERILSAQPDGVLLDLMLPRQNGYEVLGALRNAGSTVPVLVVSGFLHRAADRVRALVLGASDCVAKPVQPFELQMKVETLLREAPAAGDVAAENLEVIEAGDEGSRLRGPTAFDARLARVCQVGEKLGLASRLVGVEAPSADALDQVIGALEGCLRAEDAVMTLDKRRAVLLLMSAFTAMALTL